jgi:hypothetical protein
VKTSSMVVSGWSWYLGSLKESRAAWWVYDAGGPRYDTWRFSSDGRAEGGGFSMMRCDVDWCLSF